MSNLALIKNDIEKMAPQFAAALPQHIPVDRFKRVAVTAVSMNPDILNCDRGSILSAAMRCAQDGLLPDGREAALVKFGNKAQYMPMLAGVLKKVRNSGELSSIAAHVVYSADEFAYELGDDERIVHKPVLESRGKPVAVYAIATLKNGERVREVMSVAEVERVRRASRSANAGPWVQWWDEMARKTAIRRLAKRLPMSTDLDDMLRQDPAFQPQQTGNGAAPAPEREINPIDALNAEITAPKDDEPPVEKKEKQPKKKAEQQEEITDIDPDTGEILVESNDNDIF
jgi:recombination protein RecT